MRLASGHRQSDSSAAQAKRDDKSPYRRRYGRRLLALVLVVFLGFVFRATLLTALAAPLIVDMHVSVPSSIFLLSPSKAAIDEAAELYHKRLASRIIVLRQPPTRFDQIGLVGPSSTARTELVDRGIPEHLQLVLPCAGRSTWAFATAMKGWLSEHPADVALLVCNRFGSRRARSILDRVLDQSERARVGVRALPDIRYDETNWWQRKEGLLDLFQAYVRLGYSYANGETGPLTPEKSAEEFIGLLDLGK